MSGWWWWVMCRANPSNVSPWVGVKCPTFSLKSLCSVYPPTKRPQNPSELRPGPTDGCRQLVG